MKVCNQRKEIQFWKNTRHSSK